MSTRLDGKAHGPLKRLFTDVSAIDLLNAFVAFLFAISGPIAIMLTVGAKSSLAAPELASWIFGAFVINGAISVGFCMVYRQPLVFLWSIPGIVLVGSALDHLPFAEVVGAYLLTGVLLIVLGLSRLIGKFADLVPMPIVLGMVAGVLLQFGLNWITSLVDDPWIAAPMTVAYFAVALAPALMRRVPPLVMTLVIGVAALFATGSAPSADRLVFELVTPVVFTPQFTWQAGIELIVPLAITVLFVQNAQGIALLRAAGHRPPLDPITLTCGIGSIVSGLFGAVCTCLSGPVNGIVASSSNRNGHYVAGILVSVLCIIFGLIAPLFTSIMLAVPKAFVATLGGIALLKVLQGAFVSAFQGRFAVGALVSFMVTVSDIALLNVGAAFWGLVAGLIASWAMERADFRGGERHGS